jgi:hypothetical protein
MIDVGKIRTQFPLLHQKVHGKDLVYFDNAASTQKPQVVIDALNHYYSNDNYLWFLGACRIVKIHQIFPMHFLMKQRKLRSYFTHINH